MLRMHELIQILVSSGTIGSFSPDIRMAVGIMMVAGIVIMIEVSLPGKNHRRLTQKDLRLATDCRSAILS
jgi:hypothetical protein